MENDFQIKKINTKEEVEFTIKEINVIKTQLVVITGTIFFKHWMQRWRWIQNIANLRLSFCERCKIKGKWKERKLLQDEIIAFEHVFLSVDLMFRVELPGNKNNLRTIWGKFKNSRGWAESYWFL